MCLLMSEINILMCQIVLDPNYCLLIRHGWE